MNTKLLFTSAMVASMSLVQAQEIATWEDWCKSAVTFTFDDGANEWSSHNWAAQQLDKYNFKATFYVVTGWMGNNWGNYSNLAKKGHEIGSHTDSHSSNASELGSSKSTIEKQIGQPCLTIAYPNCVNPGQTAVLQNYIGGRICGGKTNSKSPYDFSNLDCYICGSQGKNSTNDFTSICSGANGGWAVFLIHGFQGYAGNGSYSPTNQNAFTGALQWLDQNKKDYWVTTFRDACMYIKERDNATFKKVSDGKYSLTLNSSLTSNKLCDWNYPLSVRVPASGSTASVKQAGKAIDCTVSGGYVYFKAVPNGGDIEVSGAGATVDPGTNPGTTPDTNPGSSTTTSVNPCGTFSSLNGGTTATNGGGNHNISGTDYGYEMWTNSGQSASMKYGVKDGVFQFTANWNNPDDLLCRIGLYWGTGPKPSELKGDIHCDFNYDCSGTGGGYNYIGIYGWTKTPNEVEYYIVENTFFGSTAKQQGLYYGANKVGSYTIDGEGSYDLYVGTRSNAPSISGTSTFKQVFAVRSTPRKCGHISVSEHMRKWASSVTLGQLYDCKFLCEVGAGSGSFDMKYGKMWIGDATSGGSSTPSEPSEKEEPYKGAIAIPGKLECENYDKGGEGFGYSDTDSKNEGEEYRNDGVDIVGANGGYAIGYTAEGEWLKYTINVEEAGDYNVGAYMANGSTDPQISIMLDGKKAASLTGTGSGDWDTYSLATGKISLSKGEHTLKINFDNSYTNIDYLIFSKESFYIDPIDPITPIDPIDPGATSGTFFDENGAYFGPSCENGKMGTGAFYTGDYTSPFKTVLGKTDAEIQKKLDQLWDHYFVGSNKVYFEKNDGTAYILDTGNNDVRSEGMSYGMMICVQTGHKSEFDKLWGFAKKNMLHTSGQWQGYFKWQCNPDGSAQDANCAPDGEMYFTTALMLASHRWGQKSYMDDAQYCLKNFWKGGNGSLFNEQQNVITFQPYNCSDFSDPSYDLPAFVDLFAMWSESNNSKWSTAATATRNHLYKSCNTQSGLFSDYNNFDGTPKSVSYNSNAQKYMYDAMRCAMNYGMDYYLFGKDAARQTEMAKRIIDFFEKDGYSHARFNWDGTGGSEQYTLGETGANAVACYALMNEPSYASKVKTNMTKAWNAGLATGQYRYYDGLVHYLAMLHLTGSFKIWKEKPASVKEVNAENEYNGVKYSKDTEIYDFKDCELIKVNITVDKENVEDVDANQITIVPNPASTYIEIVADEEIKSVELIDMIGNKVISTKASVINVDALQSGVYMAVISTENAQIIKKVMIKK